MNPTSDELLKGAQEYISSFRHKAIVLREIHSNLAENCRKKDTRFTVLTIFLISLSAFLGFSGTDLIYTILKSMFPGMPKLGNFNFSFNFCTFIIFFISLLNLIYRWKENHTLHFQGVVRLTHFINWIDEQKILSKSFNEQFIKDISNKYAAIIDILPPNDTCDYIEAKKSLASKSKSQAVTKCNKLSGFFNKCFESNFFKCNKHSHIPGERFFKELIYKSPLILPLLKSMRDTDERFWLGGGLISESPLIY